MGVSKLKKELASKLDSFEAACKIESLDHEKVIPDFAYYPTKHQEGMIAHAMLVIVIDAANRIANGGKEWEPDWSDHDTWKYNVYMYHPPGRGSSGFRFNAVDYWDSDSYVGSRLSFFSDEVAEFVGQNFEDLYRKYFTR